MNKENEKTLSRAGGKTGGSESHASPEKLQSSAKERHQNRKIAKSRVVRTRSTDGSILIKAENAPDTYCDRFEEACLIRQTTHDILPPGTITPDELSKLDLEKTKAFTAV
ncbi:MAG TPA: hypothetical protein PLD98_08300, partial [Clostridiales bacterium]|nr:hypothetical protein [Clostridiales bacterium]